ncbi:S8 family serine peptidase [Spirosoma arcticum]
MNQRPNPLRSERLTIDVPGIGKIPVVIEQSGDNGSTLIVRPVTPDRAANACLKENNLNKRVLVRLIDPNDKRAGAYQALRNQKIVLLNDEQLHALKEGKLIVEYVKSRRGKQIDTVPLAIRYTVGECPHTLDTDSVRLHTVLLEWSDNIRLRNGSTSPELQFTINGGRQIIDYWSQSDNIVISPDDPTSPPPPPQTCGISVNTLLDESDFKPLTRDDIDHYRCVADEYKDRYKGPTVVVLDTGLKFNLKNLGAHQDPADGLYGYRDAQGNLRHFVLAFQESNIVPSANLNNNHVGYCSVCRYKQADFVTDRNFRLSADGLPLCEEEDIVNSPFDDQRLLDQRSGRVLDGRHGTSIAAIIQHEAEVPILPVKAFDNQGFGTLFDMLNAFNYILHRQEVDDIRVVNASWVTKRNDPLLRGKIEQLNQLGVFVVAAAGNIGQSDNPNLDIEPLYPACYSIDCLNVITVTTVVQTLIATKDNQAPSTIFNGSQIERAINEDGQRRIILEQFGITDETVRFRVGGLQAAENYSNAVVNVGVLGNENGFFRSPFFGGGWLDGSSYACAFVSAAIAKSLKTTPISGGTPEEDVRNRLVGAIAVTDTLLGEQGVEGGFYLTPA